jgi:hypothetical protein
MGDIEIKYAPLPDPNALYNQGKQDLSNLSELKVGEGSSIFFTDKEGSRWGHPTFAEAKAWIKVTGEAQFKTSNGDVLLSTSALDGNFINVINSALNTSSKTILTDFTFETTDYAGAFKAGNPTWDEVTGLITGGSGVLINARGILGANNGTATFTLDATTGNATFAGTLVAASGTLGTLTGGTITGATIQTAATGARVILSGTATSFYIDNTLKGGIYPDPVNSMVYSSLDNHMFFQNDGDWVATLNGDGLSLPSGNAVYIGGNEGQTPGSKAFITSIRVSNGMLQNKQRSMNFIGGVMVDMSSESGWYNVHQF